MLKTIRYGTSTISYFTEGKGYPAVLLLHGFAEDHSIWDNQIHHLKNQCLLILPDLPGSGLSESIEDMSLEGIADCMEQVVEKECPGALLSCAVKGKEAVLVGHSMGGYISLAMAEKNPGRYRGLGLFHSTAYGDSEERKNTRLKSMEFIRSHGSEAFIRQITANLFTHSFRNQYPQIVEALITKSATCKPESLLSYYEAMIRRPDRTLVLRNFQGSVLFIIGQEDPAIPVGDSLKQCHLPHWSHIHIFENTAHMGMLENAGLSNEALKEFLKF